MYLFGPITVTCRRCAQLWIDRAGFSAICSKNRFRLRITLGPLRSHDKKGNASSLRSGVGLIYHVSRSTASGNDVSEWVEISVWVLTRTRIVWLHAVCILCVYPLAGARPVTLQYPHYILLQYALNSLLTQLVEWPQNEMQRITKST
jgi:hypothetical protein